jgi:hypothetical protein
MNRTLGIVAPQRNRYGEIIEPEADERQHPEPPLVDTPKGQAEVIEIFTLEDLKNIMMYVKEVHELLEHDTSYEYANYKDYVELLEELGVTIKNLKNQEYIDEIIDVLGGYRHRITAYYHVKIGNEYHWFDNESEIILPPKITPIDKPLDLRNGVLPPSKIITSKTLHQHRLGEISYTRRGHLNRGGRKTKYKKNIKRYRKI